MTDVIPTPATSFDELVDKQQELRLAKEAIAGSVPLIQDSPPTSLMLPRGIFRGSWQRQVEVRELTGVDEEALAKVREPTDMFDTVLALGTVRIGDIDMTNLTPTERQGWLGQLLVGERDQVYLGIAKATFGDERRLSMTCGRCQAKQDLFFTISKDFIPKEVEDVERTEFTYSTSTGEVTYRPAIGSDQAEAFHRKGASIAEQNTIILSRCITAFNGKVIVDPLNFARSLSMRDRQALLDELATRQPSVDLSFDINCVECGEEQNLTLTWVTLFRL